MLIQTIITKKTGLSLDSPVFDCLLGILFVVFDSKECDIVRTFVLDMTNVRIRLYIHFSVVKVSVEYPE